MEINYNLSTLFEKSDDVEQIESLINALEYCILMRDADRAELDNLRVFADKAGKSAILNNALSIVKKQNKEFIAEKNLDVSFSYTKEDFLTEAPYAEVFSFSDDQFAHQCEMNKMAMRATACGFKGFLKSYQAYCKRFKRVYQADGLIENPMQFPPHPSDLELDGCGWICDTSGVRSEDGFAGVQVACCHPIMPVEVITNIDTGEEKIKLAFFKTKKWRDVIVSKEITAVASKITQLATIGVAVTSENAKFLVRYLCDVENKNIERIPCRESVSRLGYVDGNQFSPYVDDLVFDGETSYKHIFEAIKSKGDFTLWLETARKCRTDSLIARILISASFASVIIKHIGGLPFFTHVWSCESATGKTVALMVAASVWGNPELGTYIQSFNSTVVGHEKMAAFLNNIPLCIDELQLSKDASGKSKFDVYQLAQGVGRTRGNKSGGVDKTPTWSNCILTTGETPIVREGAGAGAVNRVIDLECPNGERVVQNGQEIVNIVKNNYGHAGKKFVENLDVDKAKELYNEYFKILNATNTTEKQSIAAAMIMTADKLVSDLFFHDGDLKVDHMQKFLASKESVDVGARGYKYMCDWLAVNIGYFLESTGCSQSDNMPTKIYGQKSGDDWIYINQSIFRNIAEEGGYNSKALLSYLKSKNLIQTRGRRLTKGKRISGINTECVVLKLQDVVLDDEEVELI